MSVHVAHMRLIVVSLVLLSIVASAQRPQSTPRSRLVSIYADDPRPLAKAADELEKRYGWIITYEDPSYVHATEMSDVTASVRRDQALASRVLVPNGLPFKFEFAAPTIGNVTDQNVVMSALLEAHGLSGNSGSFRLERDGSVMHLIPTMMKGVDGAQVAYRSVLEKTISLPVGDRSSFEMLEAIVGALTQGANVTVSLGTVPINLLAQTRVHDGAANEQARTVLSRTLTATGGRLSWRLFYGPGAKGTYFLNIHSVTAKVVPSRPTPAYSRK